MIRVQIVYRNYIPLNSPYSSFWTDPPEGVHFDIPQARRWMALGLPAYRVLAKTPVVSGIVNAAQRLLFRAPRSEVLPDLFFYIGMIPDVVPHVPFIIDLEHVYSLFNFSQPLDYEGSRQRILAVLQNPLCRAIVPISEAAALSIKKVFPEYWDQLQCKITVIYPALPVHQTPNVRLQNAKMPGLRGLFVGKDGLRKGLPETLEVFRDLRRKYPGLSLDVVSDTPANLRRQYGDEPQITFDTPRFSTKQLMENFFDRADFFVMPTHEDTFGMVYLEALCSGKPVISTRQFALPEIVRHDVNGILLNHPTLPIDLEVLPTRKHAADYALDVGTMTAIMTNLRDAVERLHVEDGLLARLTRSTQIDIIGAEARFSIENRNRQLIALFSKALSQ